MNSDAHGGGAVYKVYTRLNLYDIPPAMLLPNSFMRLAFFLVLLSTAHSRAEVQLLPSLKFETSNIAGVRRLARQSRCGLLLTRGGMKIGNVHLSQASVPPPTVHTLKPEEWLAVEGEHEVFRHTRSSAGIEEQLSRVLEFSKSGASFYESGLLLIKMRDGKELETRIFTSFELTKTKAAVLVQALLEVVPVEKFSDIISMTSIHAHPPLEKEANLPSPSDQYAMQEIYDALVGFGASVNLVIRGFVVAESSDEYGTEIYEHFGLIQRSANPNGGFNPVYALISNPRLLEDELSKIRFLESMIRSRQPR